MSVLIKGIEMPERVQLLELHSDGKVFTRKGYLIGEAVELPDKHGRLIDADALMKTISRNCYPVQHDMTSIEPGMTVMGIMQAIQEQPTQPEIIRCRECKHYYFADNRIPQEQRYVCDIGTEIWEPDDYCSYAERREVSE